LLAFEKSGPFRRQRLSQAIRERGALLSEYGLDFGARTWTFPRRNATIAALAKVVVVVEAPVGSGALITADRARELGRPVYAVPGPLGASTWEGSNKYIADGRARMLLSPTDLETQLRLRILGSPAPSGGTTPIDRALELLAAGPADADAIGGPLGLSAADAATLIADMLLAGSIVPTGDGRFARR
jgi:DNA processing protein